MKTCHKFFLNLYILSELIIIAKCLMKISEQFNIKFIQLFKKPQQSVLFILRKGELGHLKMNAYTLYVHFLYFKLFFSYMTSQKLHFLFNKLYISKHKI